MSHSVARATVAVALGILSPAAVWSQQGPRPATSAAPAAPERIDYLTFAQGAVPLSVGGMGARLGADFERAVRVTDGDPTAFSVVSGATAETDTEFIYQLPALTTFDRFAVPNVVETPSPTVTFTRVVEVHGSATSASEGFVLLASGRLETHNGLDRGRVSAAGIGERQPIASNTDESGRSLNRRVEVKCQ